VHFENGADLFLEIHRVGRVEEQSRGQGGCDGDESVHGMLSEEKIPPGLLPVSNAVTVWRPESFKRICRFVLSGKLHESVRGVFGRG
jgi:hypothetical protein